MSHNKYLCAAHHVLLELVVRKSTRQRCLLSHTYHILKLNRKVVKKYSIIRENLQTLGGKYCCAFVDRLPRQDIGLSTKVLA